MFISLCINIKIKNIYKQNLPTTNMPKKSENTGKYILEEKILENLVALQKINADTSEKFNRLSEQISSLLTLFESAARSFAQHPANQSSEKDKEFLDKIDRLLEQNKTIAKGLTLMEENVRNRVYGGKNIEEENFPEELKSLPRL